VGRSMAGRGGEEVFIPGMVDLYRKKVKIFAVGPVRVHRVNVGGDRLTYVSQAERRVWT
jgi:hypothetical protein